jgi:hypothetical protein
MSEWTYIGIAFGLTWVTLTVYALYLRNRAARAAHAWKATVRGNGERQ